MLPSLEYQSSTHVTKQNYWFLLWIPRPKSTGIYYCSYITPYLVIFKTASALMFFNLKSAFTFKIFQIRANFYKTSNFQ